MATAGDSENTRGEGPGREPWHLCDLAELPDPGSRGFMAGRGRDGLGFFIVRRGDEIYGYVNSCPHLGVNLEWVPDRFLNPERTRIQCSLHMAQFRIEDGYCLWGPCACQSLQPVAVEVREGRVLLTDPDLLMLRERYA
ncbi:MAG TPA: Rieske (2Fe-2S) protein [Gammaproteobacteria bacterium]|nr:Rieske (2Fe-2S) protein [Gammaproteobacteria bacterium]